MAVGGGSSLDCAKGINFVLTNGGTMRDYRGFGKATRPMLPSIGVPTTAGTGSEAQSYALISDGETHAKMACGDPKAAFRVALLDPELTVTQPRDVTAMAGYDAISHAVESYVTTRRSEASDLFARDAWRWLSGNFARVLEAPDDLLARGAMLWGAHAAGIAIEQSMLGATHACANPLTARYGTTHGIAIAVMLPHVVRWNAEHVGDRYAELLDRGPAAFAPPALRRASPKLATNPRERRRESPALRESGHASTAARAGEQLASLLEELRHAGRLPASLRDIGVAARRLRGPGRRRRHAMDRHVQSPSVRRRLSARALPTRVLASLSVRSVRLQPDPADALHSRHEAQHPRLFVRDRSDRIAVGR